MKKSSLLFLLGLMSQLVFAQTGFRISGQLRDSSSHQALAFANVVLLHVPDSNFVTGTLSGEDGRFLISHSKSGEYWIKVQLLGYRPAVVPILLGSLNSDYNIGLLNLASDARQLQEVQVAEKADEVSAKLEKKVFSLKDNLSQAGGSVLHSMKNLPGITVDQSGKMYFRGSDKVMVLIDGRQTALTGFGSQAGLDNIPASAIERIEIIQNPSARYDANGSAGVINLIFKKSEEKGWSKKFGLIGGLGSLTSKADNYPTIMDQYRFSPKINPSFSINYRNAKTQFYVQGDVLWQKAINKNEFFDRVYDALPTVREQFLENRTQLSYTLKTGLDHRFNERNSLNFSLLYNREGHTDLGDLPYFSSDLSTRNRLWRYHEDEYNTSIQSALAWTHRFSQPGHQLQTSMSYTFHREDERFMFTNQLPTQNTFDTTQLFVDENVLDLNIDYVRPLKYGRLEAGMKNRYRFIPTSMIYQPGQNTILDLYSQGSARYEEWISAFYGTYILEKKKWEAEMGLRLERTQVNYHVEAVKSPYYSQGYEYLQPFPNVRFSWKFNANSRMSVFYNRRVDRPDESSLRVFPKYDDPEILKVGNPGLRPQFSDNVELGFKHTFPRASLYTALYYRNTTAILTRANTALPGQYLILSISQNAGQGTQAGIDMQFEWRPTKAWNFGLSGLLYKSTLSEFTVNNAYPTNTPLHIDADELVSGNMKANLMYKKSSWEVQTSGVWIAPELTPGGRILDRFSLDFGLRKRVQKGKGSFNLTITDLLGTFRLKKQLSGNGFKLNSVDYYETQVIRLGYQYSW